GTRAAATARSPRPPSRPRAPPLPASSVLLGGRHAHRSSAGARRGACRVPTHPRTPPARTPEPSATAPPPPAPAPQPRPESPARAARKRAAAGTADRGTPAPPPPPARSRTASSSPPSPELYGSICHIGSDCHRNGYAVRWRRVLDPSPAQPALSDPPDHGHGDGPVRRTRLQRRDDRRDRRCIRGVATHLLPLLRHQGRVVHHRPVRGSRSRPPLHPARPGRPAGLAGEADQSAERVPRPLPLARHALRARRTGRARGGVRIAGRGRRTPGRPAARTRRLAGAGPGGGAGVLVRGLLRLAGAVAPGGTFTSPARLRPGGHERPHRREAPRRLPVAVPDRTMIVRPI